MKVVRHFELRHTVLPLKKCTRLLIYCECHVDFAHRIKDKYIIKALTNIIK